ncbi:MAG: HAD-IA family hydrolase, partial [Plesiomonas shigelloides]
AEYLTFVIQTGDGLKMKPHEDLFILACQRLAIAPAALLHVGDSHHADVQGAIRAGCMAALLNPPFGQSTSLPLESPLPHLQLQDLQSLTLLL